MSIFSKISPCVLVVFTTTKLVTIGFSYQSSNQITEVNSPIGQVKRINVFPIIFKSSQRQTALLELYTSEACGSCPPAELWLSRLKKCERSLDRICARRLSC